MLTSAMSGQSCFPEMIFLAIAGLTTVMSVAIREARAAEPRPSCLRVNIARSLSDLASEDALTRTAARRRAVLGALRARRGAAIGAIVVWEARANMLEGCSGRMVRAVCSSVMQCVEICRPASVNFLGIFHTRTLVGCPPPQRRSTRP